MNIGILPVWVLAAAVAYYFGGVPDDLCAAGAAIGIGLSLVVEMRSSKALSTTLLPVMFLLMRYMILPTLSSTGPQGASQIEHLAQVIYSSQALIVVSALSMFGSYLIGIMWAHTGKV